MTELSVKTRSQGRYTSRPCRPLKRLTAAFNDSPLLRSHFLPTTIATLFLAIVFWRIWVAWSILHPFSRFPPSACFEQASLIAGLFTDQFWYASAVLWCDSALQPELASFGTLLLTCIGMGVVYAVMNCPKKILGGPTPAFMDTVLWGIGTFLLTAVFIAVASGAYVASSVPDALRSEHQYGKAVARHWHVSVFNISSELIWCHRRVGIKVRWVRREMILTAKTGPGGGDSVKPWSEHTARRNLRVCSGA